VRDRPRLRRFGWVVLTALAVLTVVAVVVATRSTSPSSQSADSVSGDEVLVYRTETCGCCAEYEDYLREEGFTVRVQMVEDIAAVKAEFGVPREAWSCHTAFVGGYLVEGHVPVAAIHRVLDDQPAIDGIALPGMPPGSPGMSGERDGPWEILSINGEITEPYMTL
jgi:hypothetical protein